MSLYELLLFVHVAGAIVWIGGAFIFQVYGIVELRSGDRAAIARFAGNAGRIGERLFIPTSILVLLAGIGLMLEGSWTWGRLWVIFALGGFAASFVLGVTALAPTAKRIGALGPESDEGQSMIRRLFALLKLDLLLLFAIVFAMTVKPTSGDTWTVVLALVVLVAASAYVLNEARASLS